MNKELGDIAMSVLNENGQEVLNESALGRALLAFVSSWKTPLANDPMFIFNLINKNLEKEKSKIENLGQDFKIDPVRLLSNIITNIESIMNEIRSNQKLDAREGNIKQTLPLDVSVFIASQFSDAVLAALESS